MTHKNIDAEIIGALVDDSRASLRSLAERLDVSITTVSNHLADLEANGVIRGYSPNINYKAFSYDVTAIIRLKVEGSALPDLSEKLRCYDQIISVYEIMDDYNILIIAKFRDTDDMNAQIDILLKDVDIHESNTNVVLNTVAECQHFQVGSKIVSGTHSDQALTEGLARSMTDENGKESDSIHDEGTDVNSQIDDELEDILSLNRDL